MIDLSHQPCVVCRKTGSAVLHTTTYPEHHYAGTFTMRRCNHCGLLFNSPRLDLKALGELYGRNYYFFLRPDSREFNRIVGMYQRTIAMLDQSRMRLKQGIDIGCGRGYFPAVLQRLGWNAAGIEISTDAAQYARSRFGLDVVTGIAEEYARSESVRQFPLVTAIDVIEHVPAPDEFVAAIARMLEPGGQVIIDTPNGAAANIQTQGAAWKGFNPFHIYLFSIENLTTLLARHGLTAELSFSYGNTPRQRGAREHLIEGLKKTGLLPLASSLYYQAKRITISAESPSTNLDRAVSQIQAGPAYSETPDSSAPLAKAKAGDNIVVIARKD